MKEVEFLRKSITDLQERVRALEERLAAPSAANAIAYPPVLMPKYPENPGMPDYQSPWPVGSTHLPSLI